MATRFYDKRGEEISLERWGELSDNDAYCLIGRAHFMDGTAPGGMKFISTRWFGVVMSGTFSIFETMVFDQEGEIIESERYATEGAAVAGHKAMVERVMAGMDNPIVME